MVRQAGGVLTDGVTMVASMSAFCQRRAMRLLRPAVVIVSVLCFAACPSTPPPPVSPAPTPAPAPAIVPPVVPVTLPAADAGPTAGAVDAGVVDEVVADECTRSNAAEGEARVDVAKASHYRIERDVKGRTINEQFDFEGYAFTTSESGCAHAGHTVTVQGAGFGPAKRDKAGLAALLARAPMTGTDLFQAALKTPDTCEQYTPHTEVLRCGDAFIEVTWTQNGATLSYDFAL